MESLHTKYRPIAFGEVVGNKAAIQSISKGIGTTKFYLLYGTRGCGKTSLARIIGKELGVDEFDLLEIDAASTRGIDAAKQLKSGVYMKPMAGKVKLYIIDECHRLTPEAQDVWLKVLEEPPDYAFFVFCTTDINKVVSTIRSRAAQFQVKPLKRREMMQLLDRVCRNESIPLNSDVLVALCEASQGVPREALVMLEQIRNLDVEQSLELIEKGTTEGGIKELCSILMKGKGNWKEVVSILKALDDDGEGARRAILGYLNAVAMNSTAPNPRLAFLMEIFMDNVFDSGKPGLTCLVMKAILME